MTEGADPDESRLAPKMVLIRSDRRQLLPQISGSPRPQLLCLFWRDVERVKLQMPILWDRATEDKVYRASGERQFPLETLTQRSACSPRTPPSDRPVPPPASA